MQKITKVGNKFQKINGRSHFRKEISLRTMKQTYVKAFKVKETIISNLSCKRNTKRRNSPVLRAKFHKNHV